MPPPRTLDYLTRLAVIRGDQADAGLFSQTRAVIEQAGINTEEALGPYLAFHAADAPPEVVTQLRYMHDAGGWVLLESAIAELPMDLRGLFESGAVTLDQLSNLHGGLGIVSAADIREALTQGMLTRIEGVDASTEARIRAAMPDLRSGVPRTPLGRAASLADRFVATLQNRADVHWASPVGSLRRGHDTIGDIEIVASTDRPRDVIESLVRMPEVRRCLHRSDSRAYLLVDRVQIGIHAATPDRAGAALLVLTGSPAHVAALRRLADARGWRLTAAGLTS